MCCLGVTNDGEEAGNGNESNGDVDPTQSAVERLKGGAGATQEGTTTTPTNDGEEEFDDYQNGTTFTPI